MELKDIVAIVWKHRWTVLGVFGIATVLSAVLALTRPQLYESTAVLALTPEVAEGQIFISSDNLSALLGTYAETAKSGLNLQRATRILGRPLPASIDTSTTAGTGILRISARATTPKEAAAAAGATAQAFKQSIAGNQLLVATLVDPASPNFKAVQPRPPLIIGVAALLGLFGGVLLAFGLEKFRRRVETPTDIAEHTTAPVVGRLPRQRRLTSEQAQIVWGQEDAAELQESYRALRTNLEFLMEGRHPVLEITSPDPSQGKSTVVANLAVAFSQIGVETIILDSDLRRPRQHEIFGLDNSTGLSTAMALNEEPELKPSGYNGLSIVTSGPIPPDPTEMLHIRLASVIKGLRETNALVFVDTPPVLPVSDARLVAPHADGVILLVTAGSHPSHLQSALERLSIVDARLLGLVLNKSGEVDDGGVGYYYGYADVEARAVREPAHIEKA
jgi:capsular exopolysaccharide synthesis family protein